MDGSLLERWLEDVVATPGLTAISDPAEARRVLLDDALRAASLLALEHGPAIDVGSGGGSPGIPLAVTAPTMSFTLLDAERRKCEFLERAARGLPNVEVVWGRAETQPTDAYGVALAKALAKPQVAAELCLPLVRPGGVAVLWTGPSADAERVDAVARKVGGRVEGGRDGLLVIRKLEPTPPGFPRRPGMAKKRPLA
jgi:16S rRNA (guanine527-N7)-methyltransferase